MQKAPILFAPADIAEPAEMRERRLQGNVKRWRRTRTLRQKNNEIIQDIEAITKSPSFNADGEEGMYLEKFHSNLESCGKHSLYRKYHNPDHVEYISTFLCSHKCCSICNSTRCKHVRRKYQSYFDKNEFKEKTKCYVNTETGEMFAQDDVVIKYMAGSKVVCMAKTGQVLGDKSIFILEKNSIIRTKDDFDFMHLTLTVPHTKAGWRGKQVYARELIKATNLMRKEKEWLKHVWGGEFGVEFTRGENGLHIHTHALLMVRKSTNSRNELAKTILTLWNKHTIDPGANRQKWRWRPQEVKYKMWRDKVNSNGEWATIVTAENELQTIGRTYQMDMFECDVKLDPRGSTHITLESLYCWNRDKTKKIYVTKHTDKYFMPALMECIKYHFEPLCLDDKTGRIDIGLLLTIMHDIKHLPLYKKFGNLHGEKSLNIKADVGTEEQEEIVKENGVKDVSIHPVTGQPDSDYDYFITLTEKTLYYGHVPKRIYLPNNCGPIHANNTFHAIKQLMGCAIADYSERKAQKDAEKGMKKLMKTYEKGTLTKEYYGKYQ